MKHAPLPSNEKERLSDLYTYNILDTLPEDDYDDITRLASEICQTPISLVTLLDQERQWFKSKQGIDMSETPREYAFCSHAILQAADLFVVPDANKDERFAQNPFVTGDPHVSFYAGVPLLSRQGYPLGTLCVIDDKPRQITPQQTNALRSLARQVTNLLELRRKTEELAQQQLQLQQANTELEQFAQMAAADMKSPCNSLIKLSDLIIDSYGDQLDTDGQQILSLIKYTSISLKKLITDTLRQAGTIHAMQVQKELFTLESLIQEVQLLAPMAEDCRLHYPHDHSNIYSYKSILLQILLQLISNAVRFNNKPEKKVEISYREDKRHYHFTVKDNGMGIPLIRREHIFEVFYHPEAPYGDNADDYGIGLSTVRKLVEKIGGTIEVSSEENIGSSFIFSVKK